MGVRTLNWREKRDRTVWSTRPSEGRVIYYAQKNKATYSVQANWRDPMGQCGGVVWYAFAGTYIGCYTRMEHAKAACERHAFPSEAADAPR